MAARPTQVITRSLLSVPLLVLQVRDAGAEGGPPAWLTSTLYDDYGKQDRVPRPWTPVVCRGREVSVWGRTMRWQDSLLPSSVVSGGTELLSGPIRVVASVGGKERPVPLRAFRVTDQQKHRVTLAAEGEIAGLRVTADLWLEYDGFLWVTLRLTDSPPGRKVDSLRVVAPLIARQTTLYQTFSRPLTGWIGTEPVRLPWLANASENIVNFYHWLGNEDRGLGFTYTSLQHWVPESEDNVCTLTPGERSTRMAINLIEKPVPLNGRTFRFGIQATPIKPLPPDYHSMVGATLQYAAWKAWYQLPENIDMTLVWPHPQSKIMMGLNHPYHVDAKLMADAVKYAHDRGVGLVSVASCPQKISPLTDEFEAYKQEWQVLPESVLDWHGTPHYQNCGRSHTLRKWLFYGWAVENVKRFGLEGIYFDGWQTGQIACSNPRHGCGWTDEQGKRHLTVPVLEGREFNQRMILFLEDHVDSPHAVPQAAPEREGFPRYHYWIHSWEFVPSVMGFATEWLTGEFAGYPLQGTSTLKPEGTLGGCLGLGLLRSRCLSNNWGVPNMFLPLLWEHLEDHPTDKQTLMFYAWLLPHGIPVADPKYMNQKTVVGISKILLDFGARQARFTPCWRKNPYFAIEEPATREVVVATWDHGDLNRVLAVVSNLDAGEEHTVRLRWKGCAGPRIADARTGQRTELADGRLRLKLGPESFALLLVTGS